MALPTDPTAPIRFSAIRNEFGGTAPDRLSEYYRGGALVPNDAGDQQTGMAEVQTVAVTGARSNVVTSSTGTNEFITIGLDSAFNAGFNQTASEITLSDLGSATATGEGQPTWGTTAVTPVVTGGTSASDWSYSATSGSSGVLQWNGTESIELSAVTFTLTINITDVPTSTSFSPYFVVTYGPVFVNQIALGFFTITGTGEYTVTSGFTRTILPLYNRLEPGDTLNFNLNAGAFHNNFPFTYEISSFVIDTGDIGTASYDFDIDTSDTHITGNVTGNFPLNVTSGQLATQHLHDQIESTYTGVTVTDPVEVSTAAGGSIEIDCTNVSSSAFTTTWLRGEWILDGFESLPSAPTWDGATLATSLINEINTIDLRSDITVRRGTGLGASFVEDSNGLVVRIDGDSAFTFWLSRGQGDVVFTWDPDWTVLPTIYANGVEYPTVNTSSTSLATPATEGGVRGEWQIVIDTGIDEDISNASLLITENTGDATEPLTFVVTDGDPTSGGVVQPASTYTVNDYLGNEVTMFTSSVSTSSASDVSTVLTTIETAIDDNTETPTDFTAAFVNNNIVLTAADEVPIDGVWSITVDHGAAVPADIGNIAFGGTVIATEGRVEIPVTLINQNVPTSGPITTDDFRGAYDPDNPINS